jgi:DNA-binding NtrC family response regulator
MGDTFDDAQQRQPQRRVTIAPHLVVVLECDRPLAGGARYSLEHVDRVTVGRGERRGAIRSAEDGVRTLALQLPGRSLSAAHARIVRAGSTWVLEDLGSKNGTFVSGQRTTGTVVSPEDICELGHTFVRLTHPRPIPADAPLDVDLPGAPGSGHVTLEPELEARLQALVKVASSGVPVLILGETGTGKEVLARWLDARMGARGPFVAVNCGAIPAALVESQLFGHTKGSFSGALRDEPGFVRAAHGGTLFLDEIAELPKASQVALLRVLQEREVVPLGATKPIPVDVRVVAATHQAIDDMVERGDFRRDLFARLAGCIVRLPPLRERLDDIGALVARLLPEVAPERASSATLSTDVGRALLRYDWPLNIRELRQCLAASLALAEEGHVQTHHLPHRIGSALEAPNRTAGRAPGSLSERDERLLAELVALLSQHAGNCAEVARAMGKARMQIHRWCKRFGIDPNSYRK